MLHIMVAHRSHSKFKTELKSKCCVLMAHRSHIKLKTEPVARDKNTTRTLKPGHQTSVASYSTDAVSKSGGRGGGT